VPEGSELPIFILAKPSTQPGQIVRWIFDVPHLKSSPGIGPPIGTAGLSENKSGTSSNPESRLTSTKVDTL
jgi:hypothetical protein